MAEPSIIINDFTFHTTQVEQTTALSLQRTVTWSSLSSSIRASDYLEEQVVKEIIEVISRKSGYMLAGWKQKLFATCLLVFFHCYVMAS